MRRGVHVFSMIKAVAAVDLIFIMLNVFPYCVLQMVHTWIRHLARELYTVIPETSCHVYLRQRVCHHDGDTTVDNPRLWRKGLVRLGGFCCWTLLVNCLPYIRSDARNPMKVKVAWEGRFKSSPVFAIDIYAGFKEVHDLFLAYFVSLFLLD